MKSLILQLDPDTRADLYADAHEHFLDFVLLEALVVTVDDLINDPNKMAEACEDPNFYLNDPDTQIASSIEFLLDVLKECDKADGVDVDSPNYCLQEFHSDVADRLSLAISSITAVNKAGLLLSYHHELNNPEYLHGMTVKGTHLGNTVVLMVSGKYAAQFIK